MIAVPRLALVLVEATKALAICKQAEQAFRRGG